MGTTHFPDPPSLWDSYLGPCLVLATFACPLLTAKWVRRQLAFEEVAIACCVLLGAKEAVRTARVTGSTLGSTGAPQGTIRPVGCPPDRRGARTRRAPARRRQAASRRNAVPCCIRLPFRVPAKPGLVVRNCSPRNSRTTPACNRAHSDTSQPSRVRRTFPTPGGLQQRCSSRVFRKPSTSRTAGIHCPRR